MCKKLRLHCTVKTKARIKGQPVALLCKQIRPLNPNLTRVKAPSIVIPVLFVPHWFVLALFPF